MSEFYPNNRPFARICKSGSDAQTNIASPTDVTFGTIEFDSYSMADLTNDRITIPFAGIYLLQGSIHWDATVNTTGSYRFLYFTINGAAHVAANRSLQRPTGGATVASRYSISAVIQMAAGDTVKLTTQNNSGGVADLQAVSNTFLSALFMDKVR